MRVRTLNDAGSGRKGWHDDDVMIRIEYRSNKNLLCCVRETIILCAEKNDACCVYRTIPYDGDKRHKNNNIMARINTLRTYQHQAPNEEENRSPRQKHTMPHLSECPDAQRPIILIIPQASHYRNTDPPNAHPHNTNKITSAEHTRRQHPMQPLSPTSPESNPANLINRPRVEL